MLKGAGTMHVMPYALLNSWATMYSPVTPHFGLNSTIIQKSVADPWGPSPNPDA